MSAFRPDTRPHRVHTVHRSSAGAVGLFLLLFGSLSLTQPLAFLSRTGPVVMGLSTNGLLAVVSVLVGGLLATAALRGGPAASTVSVVVGALFILSGVVNVMVLDTGLNMLAFQLSNVVFSLVVGLALLLTGAYGRFTGSLPTDSPYAHHPEAGRAPMIVEATAARALADAERAVADHSATPAQVVGVAAAAQHRTHVERSRAFAAATTA